MQNYSQIDWKRAEPSDAAASAEQPGVKSPSLRHQSPSTQSIK